MRFRIHFFWFCSLLFAVVLGLDACRVDPEGSTTPNAPPETHTVVDTIIRDSNQRFSSLVALRWWGSDPDGVIRGFELRDQETGEWKFTAATDSIVQIRIPEGETTYDYSFEVRAVDNDEARDPSPARLVVPVKNSPPEMAVDLSGNEATRPTNTLPVLKYSLQASDLDGASNLKHIELCFQDTARAPLIIPPDVTTVTLVALDARADSTDFQVLVGNAQDEASEPIVGAGLGQEVQLYARSVDLTDTASAWAASSKVMVRKQSSRLLLINDYPNGSLLKAKDQFYREQFGKALRSTSLDTIDLLHLSAYSAGGKLRRELPVDKQVLSRIFNLYDGIFWYANNDTALLNIRSTTGPFFDAGKKFFFVSAFGITTEAREGSFDFTPIDSLYNLRANDTVNGLFLPPDSALASSRNGYPPLVSSNFNNIRPIYASIGEPLYEGQLIAEPNISEPWDGPSTLAVLERGNNGSLFGVCAIQLTNVNKNGRVSEFLARLMDEEFGF